MIDQTVQGLASLGRNGDSMLVHMSPEEVQGLQGLAMAQGGSLTINPDTGLPEAFSLRNVFKAALPIAAGFMFPNFGTQFMGGMLGKGVAAGALTGAGIAALSGEDALMGGLMGGLGGYGGAGLAGSAAKVGASMGAEPVARTTAEANLINQGIGTSGLSTGGGWSAGTTAADLASNAQLMAPKVASSFDTAVNTGLTTQGTFPSSLMSSTQPLQTATQPLQTATSPLQTAGENFGTLINKPMDVIKDYGYGSSAMLAGAPLLAGVEPSDLMPKQNPYYDPDTGKYRGPQGQLNLSDRFDTGLRLVAKGGYIDGYALGGTVNTNPSVGGGLSDLYNRPEGATTQSISSDGYGIGRLNNLASEQSMNQAKTLGYAMGGLTALKSGGQPGGYLNGDGDGMSDSIPATIEGKQPARLADGEFVIPADVVSHLGNGSSKAGSKRLYAMLDKVRQARTGNKKQGKQIKAEKYLPA